MAAISAQFYDVPLSRELRSGPRRKLVLAAREAAPGGADVLVLDISATGLLLQAPGTMAVGDSIELEIPGSPVVQATVRWSQGGLHGCEFAKAVSTAFVSAALLRSEPAPGLPGIVSMPWTDQQDESHTDSLGKLSGAARIGIALGLPAIFWLGVAVLLLN